MTESHSPVAPGAPSSSSSSPRARGFALAFAAALALAALCALAGCGDREHMSDDYGRRNRDFFARQRVYAEPEQGSPGGLDTEEAAAIRDRYRKALAPDDRERQQDSAARVLVIEEPENGKSKR